MTGRISEAEIDDLKARNPCHQVAAQWVSLRRQGKQFIGPCPLHSPDPTARDSTSFTCNDEGWACAVCADGGDVIRLVALRNGLNPQTDFRKAIEILGGTRELDAQEAARAVAERERQRIERERISQSYRERERQRLGNMFYPAPSIDGTDAAAYLAKRGCSVPAVSPPRLRYLADCPMYDGAPGAKPVYAGPGMLAVIVNADGRFSGLHITWLDLARPNGKAAIADPATGRELPAKKVRGSKAGGRIELLPRVAPRRLIIGEGIETALSAYTALADAGRDLSDTAIWSSVDLGNLAGRATETVPHPSLKTANGRAQRVPGPEPDMNAPGLPIPDSVEEILLLGDGDSDVFLTQLAIARAAARFGRAGRTVLVAWPPAGKDFNDVLQDPAGGAELVRQLLDHAGAPLAIELPATSNKDARRKASDKSDLPSDDDNVVAFPGAKGSAPAPAPPHIGPSLENGEPSKKGGSRRRASGGGQGGEPPGNATPPDDDGDNIDARLAFYPQTDLGNAERFRERYRGKILWCPALGWLVWDGRRWSSEAAEEAIKIAEHDTVRAIQREADALRGTTRDVRIGVDRNGLPIMLSDKLEKWGRSSEAAHKLGAISKRAGPYMHLAPGKLDADKMMFNVRNGTLMFRRNDDGDSVEFVKHNPSDLITKVAPIDYDPEATCPVFDKFLSDVQPDPAMRRFLMQWYGLSLTGDVTEQRLVFNYGKGKNGKSTLIEALAYVAGDYGASLPIESFLDQGKSRNAGQATPDLATLPGVRFLRTSEPDHGAKLSEGFIKLTTGGDPIKARHLMRDYFEFKPQFKLSVTGNYKPVIVGTDEGIWRRVTLVPWSVTVTAPDRGLPDKLLREGSGILNRLLDGLRDWLDNGLKLPDEVIQATADYRSESDPVGRFLETCTAQKEGSRVQSSELHAVFLAWAKANGERESTSTWFGRNMAERGIPRSKAGVNYWLNIELTKTARDFVDGNGLPLRQPTDVAPKPASNPSPPVTEDEFTG